MQKSEIERFAKAMTALGEIYNKPVTEILVDLYWDALKKYDFQAVGSAFKKYYTGEDSTFFPKPGQLIILIEGGSEDRAIAAWSTADKQVRQTGPMRSIVFDDPVIMATIEQMGGWSSFCASPDENDHKFKGERFKKAYRANLKLDNLDYPGKLVGISEADSNSRGIKCNESVALIGSPGKCKEVLSLGRGKPKQESALMKMEDLSDLTKMLGIEKK